MKSASSSGRLLILDDDTMIAETVAIMAQRLDFATLVTLNASEFFTQFQDFDPTHVIIDLSMPDTDGLEVIKMLHGRCSAKTIILSGSGRRVLEAARRVGLAHGADIIGTLEKPFLSAQLKDLLMTAQPVIHKADETEPDPHVRQRFTRDQLSDALARDEFTIYLQPKVRCSDSRIVGFETLARWHHPEHGLISPSEFIDLFEEYDLEAVWMEKLLHLSTSCISKLPEDIHLSVNMSMSERSKASVPLLLSSIIEDLGATSERIVIEVIENGLNDATAEDIEMFARLRLGGFQLSIDDFGSGFSSLSRLVRIPFTELKIDRSFVQDAGASQEARNVISSVVAIGHSLEMMVTAEGVEDSVTLEIIKSLGCDTIQGFVYSRPVPIEEALCWIEAGGYLTPAVELQSG